MWGLMSRGERPAEAFAIKHGMGAAASWIRLEPGTEYGLGRYRSGRLALMSAATAP